MRTLIFALLLVGATAVQAYGEETFPSMDKDGNGLVSWEEFQAARPNMKRAAFDSIDTDKDGSISLEEWKAFRSSHGNRQGMPMPGSTPGQMPHKPMPGDGGSGMPLIRPPQE